MRKIALLLAATLTLGSCIGIDSKLAIRSDGSGTLSLTYRVSQFVADLGRASAEHGPAPLPVSREDFERGLQGVGGVTLKSFQRTADEKDITIRAEIAFDALESLAKVPAFRDAPPSLTESAGRHTFSQLVVKAPAEQISADTQQMVDAFFDGYAVTLRVQTPGPIQSSSAGTVSADKKELTYTASIKDLVSTKRDIVLTVTW
jgi:hypothetical protein